MRSRLLLLATAGALAAPVSLAIAADPESGTVSKSTPTVEWSGELTFPYATWLQWFQNDGSADVACEAPSCDSFALTVADGPADVTLTMTADSADSGSFEAIRVVKPDGSTAYVNNTEVENPTKLVLKKAANGEYAVDVSTGSKAQATYTASAAMAVPAAPSTPPAGGTQPPPTTNTPPQQPAAPPSDFTLTVKAPKASARKTRKGAKLKATVSVSREVESLTATLKKGKKTVGVGKLGRFAGSKKVAVKLSRKLKKGKHTLTVSARDAQGVVVTRTVAVKVKR